ncbi:MAG: hypothetical protein GQE15_39775 [Archangiaceae bacterium]|nr:hypothetical protein [Archangiaceae bacterium]
MDGGDLLFDDENLPAFLTDTGALGFLNGRGIRIVVPDGGSSVERRPSKVTVFTDQYRVGTEDWYSLVVGADGAPERQSGPVLVDGVATSIRASAISLDGELVGGTVPSGTSILPVVWSRDGGYRLLMNSSGYASIVSMTPPLAYGWAGNALTIWCLSGGIANSPAIEGAVISTSEGGGVLISNVVVGRGLGAYWRTVAWGGGDVLDVGAAIDGGFERVVLLDIDDHLLAVGEARGSGEVVPIVVQLE